MAVKLKKPDQKSTMPIGVCVGILIAALTTIVSACVAAVLFSGERLPESAMGYAVVLILLISTAVGALVGMIITAHQRMLVCLFVGGGYYALLLSCTALFFGGMYQGVGVTALVILAAALGCGLLGLTRGKGAARMKRKARIR
ncbi:MAG: TIGR04086 family membrane protein [Oscillospiraceae bacterium]|nr:TIGR04086 family membrane protein [Oscillospiraceae bacterium]